MRPKARNAYNGRKNYAQVLIKLLPLRGDCEQNEFIYNE